MKDLDEYFSCVGDLGSLSILLNDLHMDKSFFNSFQTDRKTVTIISPHDHYDQSLQTVTTVTTFKI